MVYGMMEKVEKKRKKVEIRLRKRFNNGVHDIWIRVRYTTDEKINIYVTRDEDRGNMQKNENWNSIKKWKLKYGVSVFNTTRNTTTDCNVNNNKYSGVCVNGSGCMIIDGSATTINQNNKNTYTYMEIVIFMDWKPTPPPLPFILNH